MGTQATQQQMLFKHNLNGHPSTLAILKQFPEAGQHALELMDSDKQKPGETKQAQFNRLFNILKRQQLQGQKAEASRKETEKWKEEYKAQFKGPVPPERIQQLLDEQLDRGEITDEAHRLGYLGLLLMFDYVPAEPASEIPF